MTPKCSFRIIGLSESKLNEIAQLYLKNIKYRTGSDHRDRSQKILRLPIEKTTDVELLRVLLAESPQGVYHDFFISVSSRQQTAIIEIPEVVLNLYSVIGGKLCFSYTCILDDD